MKPLIASIFLFVAGCMPEKPIEVAYNCPVITLPPLPALQTKTLNDKSDLSTIGKAYVVDLTRYVGYAKIVNKQVSTK